MGVRIAEENGRFHSLFAQYVAMYHTSNLYGLVLNSPPALSVSAILSSIYPREEDEEKASPTVLGTAWRKPTAAR